MTTDLPIRIRARPARKYSVLSFADLFTDRDSYGADTPGPTYLTYTPDGRRLITAGSNNVIRIYTFGAVGEPNNVDDCQEGNTTLVATVSIVR